MKDFEQSHEFQRYLERLRRQRYDEGVQEVDGLIAGQLGAKGMIVFAQDFKEVEQAAVAKLPHFHGAFLAVGDAGNDCEVSVLITVMLNCFDNIYGQTSASARTSRIHEYSFFSYKPSASDAYSDLLLSIHVTFIDLILCSFAPFIWYL